eukprot:ctg_280.g75
MRPTRPGCRITSSSAQGGQSGRQSIVASSLPLMFTYVGAGPWLATAAAAASDTSSSPHTPDGESVGRGVSSHVDPLANGATSAALGTEQQAGGPRARRTSRRTAGNPSGSAAAMNEEDAINGRPGQRTNQRLDLTRKAEAGTESEPELLEEAEAVADGDVASARGRDVRTTSHAADAATASSAAPSPERRAPAPVESADRSAAAEAEMRSEQLRSTEKPQLVAPSPAPWRTPQQHAWVRSHYQFLLSMDKQAEERARRLQLRRARAAQQQSRPSGSRSSVESTATATSSLPHSSPSTTATVTERSGHAGSRLPRTGVTVPATAPRRTGARATPAVVETTFPALDDDDDDDGFQEAEMVDDTPGEDGEDAETQDVSDADIDRRVAEASTDDTTANRAGRSIDVRRNAPFREATAIRPPMSASPPPSPRGRPNYVATPRET